MRPGNLLLILLVLTGSMSCQTKSATSESIPAPPPGYVVVPSAAHGRPAPPAGFSEVLPIDLMRTDAPKHLDLEECEGQVRLALDAVSPVVENRDKNEERWWRTDMSELARVVQVNEKTITPPTKAQIASWLILVDRCDDTVAAARVSQRASAQMLAWQIGYLYSQIFREMDGERMASWVVTLAGAVSEKSTQLDNLGSRFNQLTDEYNRALRDADVLRAQGRYDSLLNIYLQTRAQPLPSPALDLHPYTPDIPVIPVNRSVYCSGMTQDLGSGITTGSVNCR